MKRSLFLLLIVVILATTASAALAKPGNSMELVCWKDSQSREKQAYFMVTGSGIIHRFMMDGKHDVYKPMAKWQEMPDASDWEPYVGKAQTACEPATAGSYNDYIEVDVDYWHRYN